MYTCNDCGEEFKAPAREWAEAGSDEYDAVCPVCGSDYIEFDDEDDDILDDDYSEEEDE
ncbi:hypothetical protein IMZ48_26185 [Candidatus Bathyarchaeota archaeon]|nr:hypothetical protein [Candidatus Bathyarchaeota archaeon]